jgi:hypothetical protein
VAQQNTAAKIKLAERRQMAADLRKTGLSFQAIADMMSQSLGIPYNKAMAHRDVVHVLDELVAKTSETAEQILSLELLRLDDLTAAWWPTAVGLKPLVGVDLADPEAVRRWLDANRETLDKDAAKIILDVMARRAKMLGLDKENVNLFTPKPIVMAHADLSDVEEDDLDRIIANLQAAVGFRPGGEATADNAASS